MFIPEKGRREFWKSRNSFTLQTILFHLKGSLFKGEFLSKTGEKNEPETLKIGCLEKCKKIIANVAKNFVMTQFSRDDNSQGLWTISS